MSFLFMQFYVSMKLFTNKKTKASMKGLPLAKFGTIWASKWIMIGMDWNTNWKIRIHESKRYYKSSSFQKKPNNYKRISRIENHHYTLPNNQVRQEASLCTKQLSETAEWGVHVVSESPHRFCINYKRKRVLLWWRNLADTALSKQSN